MMRYITFVMLTLVVCASIAARGANAPATGNQLSQQFVNPPDSARPQVWWHWASGNVSNAGITADMEAWKKEGIGGGTIANIGVLPEGPEPFLSPQWWGSVKHAVTEANRLGLQLGFFNCEGWSSSGGPWITPDIAMQMVVWSETRVSGPRTVSVNLPQPFTRLGFYRDIAVVAFPTPASDDGPSLVDMKPVVTGADGQVVDASFMYDGDAATSVTVPSSPDGNPYLQFEFGQPFTAASLKLLPGPTWIGSSFDLQVSDDGQSFRTVRSFGIPGNMTDSMGTQWLTTGTFPPVTGRYFRLVFHGGGTMTIADFNLGGQASANPTPIPLKSVVNLTSLMDASGKLQWNAPDGSWTVMRFGYTPTGVHNHPVTKYGDGLECDKLSKAALLTHFNDFVYKVIDAAGPLAGKSLVYSLIDSYECGDQNWTPLMSGEFQTHNGYSIHPWLPALAGRVIESPESTQRFQEDFQQTIADLWSTNYYGYFAQLLHKRGLKGSVEAYGNGGFDNLESAGLNDMPMSEFWFGNSSDGNCAKQASSAAHTYGRPIVGAESFTSGDQFNFYPANMKIEGDWIFSNGVNRYYFHSYCQQMYTDGRKPGVVWGNGIHFTRNLTWWDQASAWLKYVARCQYMLQQGKFAADVLSFEGEGVQHFDGDPRPLKNLPPGYDYDGLDVQLLLKSLSVKNGMLTLPSGMQYRLLALPNQTMMSPAVLRRIRDLVRAGAVVFGPKPVRSFGLDKHTQSDMEVKQIANQMWGSIDGKKMISHKFGKGRIFWTGDFNKLQPVLNDIKLLPDFAYTASDSQVRFLHRRVNYSDVYFVCNQEPIRVDTLCTFRVKGRLPEIWNPESGAIEPAPVWKATPDGRTAIPISFGPAESIFVVFRKPAPRSNHIVSVSFTSASTTHAPKHTLQITKGTYLADDGQGTALDVTAKLKSQVSHGALKTYVTNIFFGMDPAPLHVKHLDVQFIYDGKPGALTVPENALLRIPQQPEGDMKPVYALTSTPAGSVNLAAWYRGKFVFTFSSGKTVRRDITNDLSMQLMGPWTLHFDPHWGGPANIVFDKLQDWSTRPEDGVKHYSGTATYVKTFSVPRSWVARNRMVNLDLGNLRDIASVSVNGHDMGILWLPPFQVNIASALKPGKNVLKVRVTNQWANRLIGDSALPTDQRIAFTTMNPYNPSSPLEESGLLGPVTLRCATVISVK
jgi:hypothetical protein